MTWKTGAVVVAGVIGLTAGGLSYLEPKTPAQVDQHARSDQVGQAGDANERAKEQFRERGSAGMDADRMDRLVPGEHGCPSSACPGGCRDRHSGARRLGRTRWVLPVTLADHLSGGRAGLSAGTLGVVTGRVGPRLEVRFDAGWGSAHARVHVRDVRTVRRGAGLGRFARRTRRVTLVRLAVAAALALLFLRFAAEYVYLNRSADGLPAALGLGVVYGMQDTLLAVAHQPVRSAVYLVVVAVLSRFAFGRR